MVASVGAFVAATLVMAAAKNTTSCPAHLSNNTVRGAGQLADANVTSLGACCTLCVANPLCVAFTYAPVPVHTHSAGILNCWIKDNARGAAAKTNRVTGLLSRPLPPPPPPLPPPPSPPLNVAISLNASVAVGAVRADFLSFTMDGHGPDTPCCDGGKCWAGGTLQTAPWEHPRLRAAGRHLAPALLRLGGSPFNGFVYDFPPGAGACARAGVKPSSLQCINASLWDRVAGFARSANVSVFFNLNYASWKHGTAAGAWNATNAQAFLAYSVARHGPDLVSALSLGNEINTPGAAFPHLQAAAARAWGTTKPLPVITGQCLHRDLN